MRFQHKAVWRHELSNSTPLDLIESKADRHTSVVKLTGPGKDVSQRGDSDVGIAVSDPQSRLAGHLAFSGIINLFGCINRDSDRLFRANLMCPVAHYMFPLSAGVLP